MAEIQFPPPGASRGPPTPIYKLLVIGDSNVGKTSLLNRYCDDNFQGSLISTVGKQRHLAGFKLWQVISLIPCISYL